MSASARRRPAGGSPSGITSAGSGAGGSGKGRKSLSAALLGALGGGLASPQSPGGVAGAFGGEDEGPVDRVGSDQMLVSVRTRPLSSGEKARGEKGAVHAFCADRVVRISREGRLGGVLKSEMGAQHEYQFDKVLGPEATQEEVYEATTREIVMDTLKGRNCTVFAYGATGAGKTHTMLGTEQDPGIIPRALVDMFRGISQIEAQFASEQQQQQQQQQQQPGRAAAARTVRDWSVKLSYLEVYNETIFDLLTESQKPLQPCEDPTDFRVKVLGLTDVLVADVDKVLSLLRAGNTRRRMESTAANQVSSRSHAVIQVNVECVESEVVPPPRPGARPPPKPKRTATTSTLSLIDLAGSERAASTQNTGARLREGANINRSLLALANCINALSSKAKGSRPKYRDSKLTHLLKSSLEGNCRLSMIAAINPALSSYEESHNTLKYANRAKDIKIKGGGAGTKRALADSEEAQRVDELVAENQELRERLSMTMSRLSSAESSFESLRGVALGSSIGGGNNNNATAQQQQQQQQLLSQSYAAVDDMDMEGLRYVEEEGDDSSVEGGEQRRLSSGSDGRRSASSSSSSPETMRMAMADQLPRAEQAKAKAQSKAQAQPSQHPPRQRQPQPQRAMQVPSAPPAPPVPHAKVQLVVGKAELRSGKGSSKGSPVAVSPADSPLVGRSSRTRAGGASPPPPPPPAGSPARLQATELPQRAARAAGGNSSSQSQLELEARIAALEIQNRTLAELAANSMAIPSKQLTSVVEKAASRALEEHNARVLQLERIIEQQKQDLARMEQLQRRQQEQQALQEQQQRQHELQRQHEQQAALLASAEAAAKNARRRSLPRAELKENLGAANRVDLRIGSDDEDGGAPAASQMPVANEYVATATHSSAVGLSQSQAQAAAGADKKQLGARRNSFIPKPPTSKKRLSSDGLEALVDAPLRVKQKRLEGATAPEQEPLPKAPAPAAVSTPLPPAPVPPVPPAAPSSSGSGSKSIFPRLRLRKAR